MERKKIESLFLEARLYKLPSDFSRIGHMSIQHSHARVQVPGWIKSKLNITFIRVKKLRLV